MPAGAAALVERGLMAGRILPHASRGGGLVTVHELPGRVAPPVLASEGGLPPGYQVVLLGRLLVLVCGSSCSRSSCSGSSHPIQLLQEAEIVLQRCSHTPQHERAVNCTRHIMQVHKGYWDISASKLWTHCCAWWNDDSGGLVVT